MKKLFAKVYYITAVIILFVGASLSANAQYTSRTISSNSWASIAARDASGNLYVVEAATQNGASDNGKVLKYTNGTGVPTVIYSGSGLPFDNCDGQQDDAPFGLAVTSNGDVYVTTTTDYFATNCSPLYGNIIKLTYNSGNNTYTESTFLAGTPSFGAFTSLAVDANDNLFCLLYDASGNGGAITNSGLTGSYEIEEFPQSGGIPQVGSKFRIAAGDALKLYVNALNSSDNYSNINGLAIDPSGNIYVADPFDSSGPAGTDGGHVYKLTKSGGSYTSSTFTSGQYTAGIASDLSGNIYTTNDPSDGTSYMLVEYAGGSSGSPQTLYSSLGVGGPELFYPVGIVPISSTNIFVCNGSTGGTNNGDLLQLFGPPTTQATNVTFSNTTSTTTTASWTNGNGTSRAVFIKQTNTGNPVPVNSTAYTANVNYASGSQVGGWYCIYNGTGTTVNITGLATGQTYRVMAVEYTGIPGSSDENYLQSAGTNNPNNVTASAGETVTFTALPVKTYGDADFSPGATSTNGAVAITYASDNPAVATIVSGNIHIVGQGTAHITASQAGDGSHSAAADVVQLLTVNKASLTITVDNQTKAYGAAVPTLTASYSGFVNSETSAILTTLPTLSTPATTSSHVAGNPYAITASGAAADNYAISYVAGSLTVNAVALTITADNQTKAYGAAIPTLTASYNGFVNGDTEASLTTMPTLSTPAVTASHVAGNPYPITPSGAVDADYNISYVAGTLTIGTASLTITADNQTKAYGAAIPTLTASYNGFVNGDTEASLTTMPTLSTTAVTASHVAGNPYPITPSGAVDADYSISYVAGTLTVGTASLTITADNQTKAYGAAVPALTASYNGFVNGDTEASLTTQPTLSTIATSVSPVSGSPYLITPSGAVDADYSISYVAGSLVIGKAAIAIAADAKTKNFGAADPALTYTITSGTLYNGDTFTGALSRAAGETAGNYAITQGTLVLSADYNLSYTGANLTISPAVLLPETITFNPIPAKTYGNADFAAGATSDNNNVAITYGSSNTAVATIIGTNIHIVGAGTTIITASQAGDAGHTSASDVQRTLTVNKANATISLSNLTAIYDGTGKSATATTNPAGLSGVTITYDGSATAPTAAGTYAVVASLTNTNYTASNATGNLTIGKASATISLASLTATYDGTAKSATATTNPAGLSGVTLTYDGSATVPTNAGTYAVVASLTNTNYTAADATGNLVIGKASATISLAGLAASYDGTAKSATATTNPAGLSGLTLTYDGSATAPTGAGTYAVVASLTNANYTAADATGNLVINKASATISLASLTATYDGTAKSATATTNPAGLSGVTITYDGSATAPTAAGSYAVVASLTNTNYTAADATGNLVIGKASATISFSNLTATYDGTAKSATATTNPAGLSGVTITYDGSATAPTAAGSYAVVASLTNTNYTAADATGNLVIGKASATISLAGLTATYDGTAKSATATTNPAGLSGVTLTYDGSATAPTAAGTYAVVASLTNTNYTAADATGNLVIGKVTATISLSNLTATYDGTAKSAIATTNPAGLSGVTITYDGSTTAPTNAGTYAVVASLANANYTAANATGSLTINKTTVTLTLSNLTATYDGTAKSATAMTNPVGLSGVTLTYDGSATAPTAAGSYAVVASLTNANYTAADATGNLVISKASVTVSLAGLTTTYDGTAKSATATTNPTGLSGVTITYDGSATVPTNAGTYAVVASLTNANYTAADASGNLVIGKGTATISLANLNQTYDGAAKSATATTNPAGLSGVTLTYDGSATMPSAAGTYAVVASLTNANYTAADASGNLVIDKGTATITLAGLTASYDGTAKSATATTNPAGLSGVTLSYDGSATAPTAAGTYAVVASLTNSSYSAANATGTLVIDKRSVTVTAATKTKTYGDADPALTYTISSGSLVGTDTFTGALSRAPGEAAGSYAITQGTLALNANYDLGYIGANLVIGLAAETITFNAVPVKTYGDGDFAAGATSNNSGPAITYASSNTAVATIVGTKIHIIAAGTTTITASQAGDANHSAAADVSQALTVNKAVLTITAGNATRIYGIANPAFTVAYNGFVNGDTQASLTSLATATTTATATSAVGAYDIIPAGAVSASYSFNYVSGKLTITTATRTLTFNPIQAKTYGDADFNAGATASTGEAIIYSGYNPAVVTIVNGKIHITGAGTTTITATVAASGNYSNTPSRSQTLTVNKANQQIAFSFIPVQLKGTTYDLSQVITASSGLPVSFTSSDDNIATVSGSILSALHIGKTTITATQAGNANYNAAAEATGTVTVNDQAGDDIVVHQAVSPNSDGINDYLYIEGINNYPQNSVVLFNRNGVLIWEGSGYDNGDRRFDGHSNETGALQQAGTYFYKIEYIANGEKKHKTGYFILKY
jgi:gliding motility-associated-like protein